MPWETIHTDSQITAIHAALLPTEPYGVVLYFGDWAANGEIGVQNVTHGRLFRMAFGLPPGDRIVEIDPGVSPTTDAFCCGQSFLSDGRLLAAGGTQGWSQQHHQHENHYDGERACWIYLPRARRWIRAEDLHFQPGGMQGGGRWYPTLVTLGNGEVWATGGHPDVDDDYPPNVPQHEKRHNNNTPERYTPSADAWTLMTADITAPDPLSTDSYPRFRLLPNGLLFSDTAGKDTGDGGVTKKRLFDPYGGVWTGPDVAGLDTLPGFYDRGSEATSVLLPLIPPLYRSRILACNSGDPTAFYIDVDDAPSWQATGPRQGPAAGRRRDNACATLLPNGKVVVTGGWPGNYQADDASQATDQPEVYDPQIDWANGTFPTGGVWEDGIDDPAPTRRGYHSCALLLPDGRVWHGGSTTIPTDHDNDGLVGDGANRAIEIYSPDYVNDSNRPSILTCPSAASWGQSFYVTTTQANSIARVALLRCGSMTHGFNTDQRYVVLRHKVHDDHTLNVQAPPNGNVAPPGYYMLFLIDDQDRVCRLASFIRISKQKLVIASDISTFSVHEVEALGPPSLFENALYIVADGFLPSEVTMPTHRLLWQDNTEVDGIDVLFGPPKYEAGADQVDVAQRIIYPVHLRFTSTAMFNAIPNDKDFLEIVFWAQMGSFVGFARLRLSKNPNPRMRDGDPPWLSIDLRVFKANPGDEPTVGLPHPGAAGAYSYIQEVLEAYNQDKSVEGAHPFDDLPTDQAGNRLELGIHDVDGEPVFNYAIARVRYRAPVNIDANAVRVFFRLWTTGWTALEYKLSGSYRRSGNGPTATPLLGLRGGEVNNIPCFAEERKADMTQQTDTTNRFDLEGADGQEVYAYAGCWLDVNQPEPRFPREPNDDGPFGGDALSVQQLMNGLHQCLVAEVYWDQDETQIGATPGSSDNLAQRNILFDFSDNPGNFSAHLVHHTFELEPSPVSFEQSLFGAVGSLSSAGAARLHPHELVIDWGDLPREALVTLTLPQVDCAEIVRASAVRQGPGNLSAPEPGTLRVRVSDVAFIPIPGPLEKTIAGLISVQLPPGVPRGKVYRVVFRQVDGRTYKVLGTTEFRIEVGLAEELLPRAVHDLAILKHIAKSIPESNRWYPIFKRYLAELGDRIRAFGGDPEAVDPSPWGTGGPRPVDPGDGGEPCDDDPGGAETAELTGKVTRLLYDCFGAFEGFEMRDCDRPVRFAACDRGIEQVALTACRDDFRLRVVYDRASRRIRRLELLCCGGEGPGAVSRRLPAERSP